MTRLPAFALSFSIAASSAAAKDRLEVMLDWFVNPDHGPLIIAEELGYFDDAGLDVELITPSDPNAPPRMVAAGNVDLAVSYQPQLHLNRRDGLPLVRVGTLVETPLACLVVLADGPVRDVSDLASRKVGFAVAGVQEMLLSAMLADNGLDADSVEKINVGWSISPALMSGQVDGVIGAFRNFELNQMAIEGVDGRCFFPEQEGVPAYDELIYVAHGERLDVPTLARFVEATERAAAYIQNDPDGSWEIFAATDTELRNELNERAWRDTWPRFALRPGALDLGRYERFEEFLLAQGAIDDMMDPAELAIDITGAAR